MKIIRHNIEVKHFKNFSELTDTNIVALCEESIAARSDAYAIYSNYPVEPLFF